MNVVIFIIFSYKAKTKAQLKKAQNQKNQQQHLTSTVEVHYHETLFYLDLRMGWTKQANSFSLFLVFCEWQI